MKRMSLFLFGYCFCCITWLYGSEEDLLFVEPSDPGSVTQDIQQQVVKPTPTCLPEIITVLDLKKQIDDQINKLGDFTDIAHNEVFPKICVTDGQVKVQDNVVVITPSKTQATKLDDLVRVFVQNGKKGFSAGIRYATIDPIKPYLTKIPNVSSLFDLFDFSNVVVAFASANDKGPLLDVSNVRQGLTFAANLTVKSGNFLYEVLSQINLTKMQLRCTVPPGIKSVKEVKTEMVPLEDFKGGICLAAALKPVLQQIGLSDIAEQMSSVLALFCLGTNIGATVDANGNLIFYIQGQLKAVPSSVGAVKVRARVSSDQPSPGKYILTAGMKLSSANNKDYTKISSLLPQLQYLDEAMVIADPVVCVSNDKGPKTQPANTPYTVGLFDIDSKTKLVDSTLPGAMSIGYGVTIGATIASGTLLETIRAIKPLNDILDHLRLQVHIASKDKIDVQITRSDDKPITLSLSDFLGADQLQQVPLVGDLSKTVLTISAISIDKAPKIGVQLVASGAVVIAGITTNIELRMIKDTTGVKYAAKISTDKTFTLGDLDKSLSSISDQAGSLNKVDIVVANSDMPGLWEIPHLVKGVSIAGDYTTSGFISDVTSEIGFDKIHAQITLSKDQAGKIKPVVMLEPVNEPAQGICLLKALKPLLDEVGLQSVSAPLSSVLGLLCFGTDVGMAFDQTGNIIFYIQGPLKNLPATGAAKARARVSSDQPSPGKYILTAGMKLSSANNKDYTKISSLLPQLQYLDEVVVIADPVVCVSNNKGPKTQPANTPYTVGLFDIDSKTKLVDPALPGAMSIGYGVTIGATIASGTLLETIKAIKPLNDILDHLRLQVHIASKDKIDVQITRSDDKPITLSLSDFLGADQLQQVPLVGDLSKTVLTISAISIDKAPKIGVQLVANGAVVIAGATTNIELRMIKDTTGVKYAAKISTDKTFTLGDLDKNLSSISNQAGSLNKVDIVVANSDMTGLWEIPHLVKGVSIAGDYTTSGFISDVTSEIGFDKIHAQITLSKDQTGKIKPVVMLEPVNEPAQGICLLKALKPLLDEVGLQSVSAPLSSVLGLLCFGTDVGMTFDQTGNIIFYIQGPLKNLSAIGAAKARARVDSDQPSPGKYILTAGMKLSSANKKDCTKISSLLPQLSYLDEVMIIADPVVCVSNDKGPKTQPANTPYTVGLFDINSETKMVDSTLPGAMKVGYGVTVAATISSGTLLEVLKTIKPFAAMSNNIRLQVRIANANDISVHVTRADDQPFAFKLTDLPGLDQLSNVPVFGNALNVSINVSDVRLEKNAQQLEIVVDGDLSFDNKKARSQIRMVVSGGEKTCVAGIFLGGEFSLTDLSKNFSPVKALGQMKNITVIFSNTDAKAPVFGVQNIKSGVNIVSDFEATKAFAAVARILFGYTELKAVVSISRDKSGALQPQLTVYSPQQEQPLCLSDLQSLIPDAKLVVELVKKIVGSDVCVDRKSLVLVPTQFGVDLIYRGMVNAKWPLSLILSLDQEAYVNNLGVKIETTATFDLGQLNSKLQGLVTLENPTFMIATKAMNQEGIDVLRAGCSVGARVSFGSYMGDALRMVGINQFVNSVMADVTIPFDTTQVEGYEVRLTKTLDHTEKPMGDMLQIRGFGVKFKGGVPPAFGFDLNTIFRAPGSKSDLYITLGAAVAGPTYDLFGTARCLQAPCPSINLGDIFPVSVHATPEIPLAAKVHIGGGQITGFGGSGVIDIADKTSKIEFDIDTVQLSKSGARCHFDRLCLSDIAMLYELFFSKASGFDASLISRMPQLFCITNVDVSVAKNKVFIAGTSIEPGLTCKGTFDSQVLPVHGTVDIVVIPPTLVNLLTKTADIGLSGTVTLDPINLGNGLIKVTAVGSSSGPILQVNATPTKQNIRATADVVLGDPALFSQTADVTFNTDGLQIVATREVLGLSAQFGAVATFKDPLNAEASITLTNVLTGAVQGALNKAVGEIRKNAIDKFTAEVHSATDNIKSAVNSVVSVTKNVPGSDDINTVPDKIDAFVNDAIAQANAQIDSAMQMTQLSIDSVVLRAKVSDLKSKGLVSGTVNYTLLGNKDSATLAPFDIKDAPAFANAVARAITAKIKLPDFGALKDTLLSNLKKIAGITVDANGVQVNTTKTVVGMSAQMSAQVPFNNPANTNLTFAFTSGLTQLVGGKLDDLKKKLSGVTDAAGSIKSVADSLPGYLSGLPGASELRSLANSAGSIADQAKQRVADALRMSINKIVLSANMDNFKKGLLSGTVYYTIFGQDKSATLAPFDMNNKDVFVTALTRVIDIGDNLDSFKGQLNDLLSSAKRKLEELLHKAPLKFFDDAMKFAGDLGGQLAGVVGDVVGDIGKLANIGDLVNQLNSMKDVLDSIGKGVSGAVDTVKDALGL